MVEEGVGLLEQTPKERIIRVSSFDGLKEVFRAKEGEKTGGVVNVSILRHCKPASDKRDAPLSEEGRAQAEEVAKKISQEAPIIIAFGPLPRAKETAEILANNVSGRIYLIEDERLNKPSWNLPERRFGKFVDKLREKPPKTQVRLFQMFYGAIGEKAMAEEPARELEDFLDGCTELASTLPSESQLDLIAISHIETMTPYLIRRWGLNLFGRGEWKSWRELRGIKEGSGFSVTIDVSGDRPKKTLEIAGEKFEKNG